MTVARAQRYHLQLIWSFRRLSPYQNQHQLVFGKLPRCRQTRKHTQVISFRLMQYT